MESGSDVAVKEESCIDVGSRDSLVDQKSTSVRSNSKDEGGSRLFELIKG